MTTSCSFILAGDEAVWIWVGSSTRSEVRHWLLTGAAGLLCVIRDGSAPNDQPCECAGHT